MGTYLGPYIIKEPKEPQEPLCPKFLKGGQKTSVRRVQPSKLSLSFTRFGGKPQGLGCSGFTVLGFRV